MVARDGFAVSRRVFILHIFGGRKHVLTAIGGLKNIWGTLVSQGRLQLLEIRLGVIEQARNYTQNANKHYTALVRCAKMH
jgi:hypothetical protein